VDLLAYPVIGSAGVRPGRNFGFAKYEDPQAEDCGGFADPEYLRALSLSIIHGYNSSSLTKLFSESPDTQRHKHDREKEQS